MADLQCSATTARGTQCSRAGFHEWRWREGDSIQTGILCGIHVRAVHSRGGRPRVMRDALSVIRHYR